MKTSTCFCGAPKMAEDAFCNRCYYALPPRMRAALWRASRKDLADVKQACREYLAQSLGVGAAKGGSR